ncbi:ABC transporter related [Methanococcus vannielii SB]|uniref:ABC transporter related n=1 Tax=Methanococcus vannielii (strain ATCC 35089 / DSM 1224 / JCM 13029 / OCM 148 / SB) TaxID=406327 RepID=A6UQS1_METVS|nr:ATP-binding cassette domain-containing protein [Methanococcus vannielii]ABR54843.1 ABC transporter related [Methanococcus vannielii SB]
MSVRVQNLTKKYGEKVALDNLDFEIKKGEIFGIIGRSGAGKTTLIRILRGVENFDSGNIEVLGRNEDLREITAIHIQRNFALWAEPVIYNIIRKLYAIRTNSDEGLPTEDEMEDYKKDAEEILKLVGLEHKKNAYSNILSGGEKQRLILGRQIAKIYEKGGDGVLLLDEPATMACPASKQLLLDVLKNINEKLGVTIIVTSHLPEIHKYLCNTCILLENGKLKIKGNPELVINEFLKEIPEKYAKKTGPLEEDVIEVSGISKRYYVVNGGETLNLKDISFNVKKKEIISIIGPSGTGKSVILRLLAGLDVPDSGTIKLEGLDLKEFGWNRMELRRRIGIMHQEFSLAHYLTVKELLNYRVGIKSMETLEKAKEKAEEIGISPKVVDGLYQLLDLPETEMKNKLEKMNIPESVVRTLFPPKDIEFDSLDILDALDLNREALLKKPTELSGGERVRVALALQLALKPDILLLDEPFGDLDPITLRDVSNYIKKINDIAETTIVMISHHINLIKEISDRAVLIDEGKLLIVGNTNDVCEKFIERSNSKFMSS